MVVWVVSRGHQYKKVFYAKQFWIVPWSSTPVATFFFPAAWLGWKGGWGGWIGWGGWGGWIG